MSAMVTPHTGCVHLSCRAWLEHARPVPGKPRSYVFDALIYCGKRVNNTCLAACSLQYYKADDNAVVSDGIYDINAIVVAYRPNVNVASPVLTDKDFKLMGDISDIIPVPMVDMIGAISACKVPAKVFAAGTVTSVDTEQVCFAMTPSQDVTCSGQIDSIELRAIMEKSPKWPNPVFKLPCMRLSIACAAKLSHFEEIPDAKGSDMKLRMVVTLDAITDLGFRFLPSSSSSSLLFPQSSPSLFPQSSSSLFPQASSSLLFPQSSALLPSMGHPLFPSTRMTTPEDADTIALRERVQRHVYGDRGSKGFASNPNLFAAQR